MNKSNEFHLERVTWLSNWKMTNYGLIALWLWSKHFVSGSGSKVKQNKFDAFCSMIRRVKLKKLWVKTRNANRWIKPAKLTKEVSEVMTEKNRNWPWEWATISTRTPLEGGATQSKSKRLPRKCLNVVCCRYMTGACNFSNLSAFARGRVTTWIRTNSSPPLASFRLSIKWNFINGTCTSLSINARTLQSARTNWAMSNLSTIRDTSRDVNRRIHGTSNSFNRFVNGFANSNYNHFNLTKTLTSFLSTATDHQNGETRRLLHRIWFHRIRLCNCECSSSHHDFRSMCAIVELLIHLIDYLLVPLLPKIRRSQWWLSKKCITIWIRQFFKKSF